MTRAELEGVWGPVTKRCGRQCGRQCGSSGQLRPVCLEEEEEENVASVCGSTGPLADGSPPLSSVLMRQCVRCSGEDITAPLAVAGDPGAVSSTVDKWVPVESENCGADSARSGFGQRRCSCE